MIAHQDGNINNSNSSESVPSLMNKVCIISFHFYLMTIERSFQLLYFH